jgi:hypothetical protein
MDNTVTIDKETLQSILTCLQVSQAKVGLLQIQTQLLHNALEQKNLRKHSELILVQNNPFFEEDDSDQQLVQKQLNETTSDSSTNANQLPLSKLIIRSWEEIRHNKHRTDIGNEKEATFHIPDYTKPIQFQGIGLLQESSHSLAPVQEQISICQHCQGVGHMEDQWFNLHPCEHCGQHNHPLNRCSNNKKPARIKNRYGWIPLW